MKGARTGLGISSGAAFGIILGLLLFEDWWWGSIVGTLVGLIVGAIADAQVEGEK